MASITALQLVNRVLRRVQKSTVSDFSEHLGAAVLDLVNAAKNEVLESRIWPFDIRHDGVLTLKGSATLSDVDATNGSAQLGTTSLISYWDLTKTNFGRVDRIVLDSDADFGNTAFRIRSFNTTPSPDELRLDVEWPGTTVTGASATVFSAEYLLPTTVRSVLSVRHQEQDLKLDLIDPSLGFDQLFPRPLDEINDEISWVGIGGQADETVRLGAFGDDSTRTRMVVHPIPESDLVLHYRYVYLHPDLSSTSDTLDDVPPSVQNEIVNEAVGHYLLSPLGGDAEAGQALLRERAASTNRKADAARPDPFRRRTIKPLDTVRGGARHDPFPTPFGESEL